MSSCATTPATSAMPIASAETTTTRASTASTVDGARTPPSSVRSMADAMLGATGRVDSRRAPWPRSAVIGRGGGRWPTSSEQRIVATDARRTSSAARRRDRPRRTHASSDPASTRWLGAGRARKAATMAAWVVGGARRTMARPAEVSEMTARRASSGSRFAGDEAGAHEAPDDVGDGVLRACSSRSASSVTERSGTVASCWQHEELCAGDAEVAHGGAAGAAQSADEPAQRVHRAGGGVGRRAAWRIRGGARHDISITIYPLLLAENPLGHHASMHRSVTIRSTPRPASYPARRSSDARPARLEWTLTPSRDSGSPSMAAPAPPATSVTPDGSAARRVRSSPMTRSRSSR